MKRTPKTLLAASALFASMACGPVRAGESAMPFIVTVAVPAAKAGAAAVARVEVRPAAGYHMNKEFPTSLKLLAPPGVDLPKSTIRGNDPGAKISEAELLLVVPFTAKETGMKTIKGTLKFAVCTATSCDPRTAPVSITVDVK